MTLDSLKEVSNIIHNINIDSESGVIIANKVIQLMWFKEILNFVAAAIFIVLVAIGIYYLIKHIGD